MPICLYLEEGVDKQFFGHWQRDIEADASVVPMSVVAVGAPSSAPSQRSLRAVVGRMNDPRPGHRGSQHECCATKSAIHRYHLSFVIPEKPATPADRKSTRLN